MLKQERRINKKGVNLFTILINSSIVTKKRNIKLKEIFNMRHHGQ